MFPLMEVVKKSAPPPSANLGPYFDFFFGAPFQNTGWDQGVVRPDPPPQ